MIDLVRHTYFNATDNLAQYEADRCGRQAITIADYFADDRLCDLAVWTFNVKNHELGLEPWRDVGSAALLDRWVPGKAPDPAKPYLIGDRSVGPDHVLFVQKRDLIALGFQIPESVMDEFHRTRDFRTAMRQRVVLPKPEEE